MAVYFNDLTLDKIPQQNNMLLKEFWKVMKKFSDATEGREKRVLANDESVAELMNAVSSGGDPSQMMFLSTFFAKPFQDEEASRLMARAAEHTSGEAEYHLANDEKSRCSMMGWAYHERSITLGLNSSPYWRQLVYPVERTTIEGDELVVDIVESVCVTNEKQIGTSRMQGWIAAQRDFETVELPPVSSIPVAEKKIKYCDDHGREILDAFAHRLVRCKYVDAVINSTPYRRNDGNQFIYDIRDDGIVYLCLHWCQDRYGLAVQTTARWKLQTQLVAEVLREKFDRKS